MHLTYGMLTAWGTVSINPRQFNPDARQFTCDPRLLPTTRTVHPQPAHFTRDPRSALSRHSPALLIKDVNCTIPVHYAKVERNHHSIWMHRKRWLTLLIKRTILVEYAGQLREKSTFSRIRNTDCWQITANLNIVDHCPGIVNRS